jgi:hypothetical protein
VYTYSSRRRHTTDRRSHCTLMVSHPRTGRPNKSNGWINDDTTTFLSPCNRYGFRSDNLVEVAASTKSASWVSDAKPDLNANHWRVCQRMFRKQASESYRYHSTVDRNPVDHISAPYDRVNAICQTSVQSGPYHSSRVQSCDMDLDVSNIVYCS